MANINGLYIYEVSPMDFGWESMRPIDEYRAVIDAEIKQYDSSAPAAFDAFVAQALDAGKQIGWEGDFRDGNGPHVAVIPDHNSPKLSLVWKQENDGTTFIASQVPFTHLD